MSAAESKPRTIRMSDELIDLIDAAADAEGITRSEWVRTHVPTLAVNKLYEYGVTPEELDLDSGVPKPKRGDFVLRSRPKGGWDVYAHGGFRGMAYPSDDAWIAYEAGEPASKGGLGRHDDLADAVRTLIGEE